MRFIRQNPPSSDFAGNSLSNWINYRGAHHPDEAVYYSNLVKTKEILGDILSSTTGMNRGRIEWSTISEVEVPQYDSKDKDVGKLVKQLKSVWKAHEKFLTSKRAYLDAVAKDLELNGLDAQERWLGFKPPE